jgi:transposase InsO family protein
MGTVQRLYHTLPAQSTPSSAFIGHPPTTAVTAYISITKNENSYAIKEVLTAPQSPWQNPYVERLIGSIRRECLDHVIVLHERHLQPLLTGYFAYYHHWRTHLSLAMDCPKSRPIQLPDREQVIGLPEVGGLHHHYERVAA